MAGLLFPCVRPLTCRTAAVLRVMKTLLPVRMLHISVSSHVTHTPGALMRPSCYKLSSLESAVRMRHCCRGFTSQGSEDSVFSVDSMSKSNSQKTEDKYIVSPTSTDCSVNANFEQDDCHRTRAAWSQEGETETCSRHDIRSNTDQDRDTEDLDLTNPADSASASEVDDFHDEHTNVNHDEHTNVNLADSQPMWDVHTDTTSVSVSTEEEDVQQLPPARPMEPSFTLVPYVVQSPTLQRLVALGVDLAAVEKVKGAADRLVQADWDTDIQPRLLFLRDVGVDNAQLGTVLTKNPLVLKENVEAMQGRIKYLKAKKFSLEQIARIVTSAPLALLLPVTYLDKKLGFLQKTFHLTGDEVRLVASKLPKILPWKLQKLKDIRFYMKEMLGFSDRELKSMLLITPRVFLSERHQLGKKFDLLHNVMGLSHRHLTAWPAVFRTRFHILEQRHRFLLLLGRAQYDPSKENYVSLQALVSGRDRDFCFHVAKASTSQFYSFLKSI